MNMGTPSNATLGATTAHTATIADGDGTMISAFYAGEASKVAGAS